MSTDDTFKVAQLHKLVCDEENNLRSYQLQTQQNKDLVTLLLQHPVDISYKSSEKKPSLESLDTAITQLHDEMFDYSLDLQKRMDGLMNSLQKDVNKLSKTKNEKKNKFDQDQEKNKQDIEHEKRQIKEAENKGDYFNQQTEKTVFQIANKKKIIEDLRKKVEDVQEQKQAEFREKLCTTITSTRPKESTTKQNSKKQIQPPNPKDEPTRKRRKRNVLFPGLVKQNTEN
ncbi:Uncharacterized protein QTN25_003612 [Entamoeba marina]